MATRKPTTDKKPTTDPPPAADVQRATTALAGEPLPRTVSEILQRMDEAWDQFHAAAAAVPADRMNERLGTEAWTRKQMLAHIGAWHELTFQRLNHFALTGELRQLDEETDAINARVARIAVGRTIGEVMNDMLATYRRLRRLVEAFLDRQLADHDAWPAAIIAGNTYGHYAEHMADVELPQEPSEAALSSG